MFNLISNDSKWESNISTMVETTKDLTLAFKNHLLELALHCGVVTTLNGKLKWWWRSGPTLLLKLC